MSGWNSYSEVCFPAVITMRGLFFVGLVSLLIIPIARVPVPAQEMSPVRVWWSSELLPESPRWFTDPPGEEEIRHRLDRKGDLSFQDAREESILTLHLDPEKRFQEVLGIGTSLEGTTIYAIRKNRSRKEIKDILRTLIDPEGGIGFSLFRIPIGTADFSDGRRVSNHPKGFYTHQDGEDDEFSIEKDIRLGIVETLRLVREVAGELGLSEQVKFFASSWSPPAWMKTSGRLIGGTLKAGYEKRLARYFRNFIEAYEEQGIPIHAINLQNEPHFVPSNYPGMRLTREQELSLVVACYEEFHKSSEGRRELNTRIWINDHNFEYWVDSNAILSSLQQMGKKHYVNAVAFHNYSDSPAENMSELRKKHPDTDIVFTEHSEWGTAGMHNIQQYFWNWSRSYMYWVAATTRRLDEHNQSPFNRLGELSPTLLIEKDPGRAGFYRTPEFYLLGQFAKFVRPGALRIGCDRGSPEAVTAVAFLNRDHRVAVVAVNQTEKEQPFQLSFRGKAVRTSLPYKTAGTYTWTWRSK